MARNSENPLSSPVLPQQSSNDVLHQLIGSTETRELVRRKARRLIAKCGPAVQDLDDAIQILNSALVRDGRRFDSAQGSWLPFAERSLQYATKNALRHRWSSKGNRCNEISLNTLVRVKGDDEPHELAQFISSKELEARTGNSSADPVVVVDLHSDLDVFKAALPPKLRELAVALERETILEISRRTRVHRSTIYDSVAAIRKLAEDSGLANYVR